MIKADIAVIAYCGEGAGLNDITEACERLFKEALTEKGREMVSGRLSVIGAGRIRVIMPEYMVELGKVEGLFQHTPEKQAD